MKKIQAVIAAFVALSVVPLPSYAEPPPHAKAHGWRKKNDPSYAGYTGKKWERDYGVTQGKCNTDAVGAVLGGVAGGVIGSKVGKGENRPVAILLGTVIGAVIGHEIGREIDDADRACMGHALELSGRQHSVAWTNQKTGMRYVVTPTRNFNQGGVPCREFTTQASKGGKASGTPARAVACRKAGGEWEMKKL